MFASMTADIDSILMLITSCFYILPDVHNVFYNFCGNTEKLKRSEHMLIEVLLSKKTTPVNENAMKSVNFKSFWSKFESNLFFWTGWTVYSASSASTDATLYFQTHPYWLYNDYLSNWCNINLVCHFTTVWTWIHWANAKGKNWSNEHILDYTCRGRIN